MEICENCAHKGLCKYEDECRNFALSKTIETPEFITVEIKCKNFSEDVAIKLRESKLTQFPKFLPAKITSFTNMCDGCLYHERYLKGEVHIGENPCQWCGKNPHKIINTTAGN